MTNPNVPTGGETPRWYHPWQFGEDHWWFWTSCIGVGIALPLACIGLLGWFFGFLAMAAVLLLLVTYVGRHP